MYQKDDEGLLIFTPDEKRYVYWSALMYLTGVDLLASPNKYFHDINNVIEQYEIYWGKYEK